MKKPPKGKAKGREVPDLVQRTSLQVGEHQYCIITPPESIYDGDTIRNVSIEVWPGIHIDADLRLSRIQAPEIRTKDTDEKAAGFASRDFLTDLIANKPVLMKVLGKGKYGRLIVELFDKETGNSISDMMIENGHARWY